MFGLFKNKQSAKNQAAIAAANKIAHDFSDLIASGRVNPGQIYDVSVLPHAKELIEKCCKLWIMVCQDSTQLQGWKVILPILSQFQKGIGATPLGLDATALMTMRNEDVPIEEHAMRISEVKMPSLELEEKVHAEERALHTWVTQAVGGRV
ncbi:MAG: hypothetical protein KF722_18725 [Nitrospira sp.]|nr:hypothetical protein [Nitrospira sp.]